MGKLLKKIAMICLFAVLLEVVYFNYSALRMMFGEQKDKNLAFQEENTLFVNWEKQGSTFVSTSVDPQMLFELDAMKIDTVVLQADTVPAVVPCQFFYTNANGEVVAVEGSTDPEKEGCIEFQVDDWSSDLIRIDIGDAPGIQLGGFTVTVNPVQWHISLSRIIAVVLIYLLGSLLFRIQRMPDYGITLGKESAHDR